MTQRSHPTPRSFPRAVAAHHLGWRAAAQLELELVRAWSRSGMTRGLEWLLQLAMPMAATVLEMQNVKRRIPEIGEIEQAVRSVGDRARWPRPMAPTFGRSPFED